MLQKHEAGDPQWIADLEQFSTRENARDKISGVEAAGRICRYSQEIAQKIPADPDPDDPVSP